MTEIILLRLVHILGGTFWVGAGVFSVAFLSPVLMRLGPAAGPVMAGLQARRLFLVLPTVALLTIGSGLRLMWIVSSGLGTGWFSTRMGQMYSVSGALAIIAFLIAMFVSRPSSARAMQLGTAAAAATEESERARIAAHAAKLRSLASVTGNVVLALLVLAAAGMAVARYLA